MKYNPKRDLPKAVRELRTLSPKTLAEWVTQNRTRTVKGKRIQYAISDEAIRIYFVRHPKLYEELKNEIEQEELTKQAISEDLFINGTFKQIPCIDTWLIELGARGYKGKSGFITAIKQVCMGIIPKQKKPPKDQEVIEGWGLKHPRLLSLEDGMRYIKELSDRGRKTRRHRLALRNFLESRGIKGATTKISGKLEQSAGQYAHLYTKKMPAIFNWLKRMNREAHDSCFFAFKTACRKTATMEAHTKYVDKDQKTITVFEKATKGSPKRKQEKLIPQDLWEILQPRIERGGKLFDIKDTDLNGLLRACYQEVIPELADEIPMPFHFFRHQFAQHLLRKTGWNYGLVARLGHWTVETLERYYGKMDRQTAMTEGRTYLPQL
jgi:integrase